MGQLQQAMGVPIIPNPTNPTAVAIEPPSPASGRHQGVAADLCVRRGEQVPQRFAGMWLQASGSWLLVSSWWNACHGRAKNQVDTVAMLW